MFSMPVNLSKTYTSPTKYAQGQRIVINNVEYVFGLYNDGDGDVIGARGMTVYDVGANDADVSTPFEFTCDLSDGTVVSNIEFAGVIYADIISHGEYGWFARKGEPPLPLWTNNTAIDRSTLVIGESPGTGPFLVAPINSGVDGTVAVLGAAEERIFAKLKADVIAPANAASDRVLATFVAAPSANFVLGETVTESVSSDTGVVQEILRTRAGVQRALIISTVDDAGGFTAGRTLTGSSTNAAGEIQVTGFQLHAGNYELT